MNKIKASYITDENGKKLSAIIPMKDFEELLALLEDYLDLETVKEVKESKEKYYTEDEAIEFLDNN